jgi:hypothetical protein
MLKEILFVQSVDGFLKWSENGLSDMASYLRRLECQYRQIFTSQQSHMVDNKHNV